MTFLSYKLNHKEYEKILATDGRALYLEVASKKIPFYDWAKWIDEKFEKEWFDFKYRSTKRMMIVVQPKTIPEAKDQEAKKAGDIKITHPNYFKKWRSPMWDPHKLDCYTRTYYQTNIVEM